MSLSRTPRTPSISTTESHHSRASQMRRTIAARMTGLGVERPPDWQQSYARLAQRSRRIDNVAAE